MCYKVVFQGRLLKAIPSMSIAKNIMREINLKDYCNPVPVINFTVGIILTVKRHAGVAHVATYICTLGE